MPFPHWRYFPARDRPPPWTAELLGVFGSAQSGIHSVDVQGEGSDGILRALRPGLVGLGYEVELSKKSADKIDRPVLFGDEGSAECGTRSTPGWKTLASYWRSKRAGDGWGTPSSVTSYERHSSWALATSPSASC